MDRHLDFAPVVTIHHTHAVGGTKPLLCSKAAPGKYGTEVTVWDLYRQPGPDDVGAVRMHDYILGIADIRVQIAASRLLGAVSR